MKRCIPYIFVYLILALMYLLSSCGARKSATEIEKIKADLSVFKQNNLTTNAQVTITEIGTTYTPVDPKVPMVLPDGRVSTNAKIQDKKKTKDSVSRTEDKGTAELKDKGTKKSKAKEVDSDRGDPWKSIGLPIGIGLAIAIIVFAYFKSRKS